jgi:serine-type D-Ala-D-Ala carboxypeptidase (penicillin-binding protein 5/6)
MAVLVLVAVGILAVFVGVRIGAAAPPAQVTATLATSVQVQAPARTLPWPKTGQAAVAVPSIGIDVASAPEHAAPIASLTKMMTAYIVLRDHPLRRLQNGPRLTMTQTDVNDFNNDTVQDEANAQVKVGEVLTERQLLSGMLVHSANNFADTLARWDAGSIPAFVAKMNRTAAQLGMHQTHYVDPSGFAQGSQSTPADLLRVAAPDMENPTFASIVKQTSITLPVAGTISSYTPLLGFQGVIGVKSGYTSQAGGCDVLAVVRQVHGEPVLILGAVTGQKGPNILNVAALQALTLANSVSADIGATPIVTSGQVVAHVSAGGHTINATARGTANVLSWPGVKVTRVLETTAVLFPGARAGTVVGSVIVLVGSQRVVLPVRLSGRLPEESWNQRLF